MVLPKNESMPAIVTASGPTIGLRVPAQPTALALLQACDVPVAAPSANRSSQLSPTCGAHVLESLNGRIDLLLDAGPTSGGLESTVLDLTSTPPVLLRPGLISKREIEAIVGPLRLLGPAPHGTPLRSPGLLDRHYAPRTPLECVTEDGGSHARHLRAEGLRVGWLTYLAPGTSSQDVSTIVLPNTPREYAAGLYAALHELDACHLDRIVVTWPPDNDEWLAIRDRLTRAQTR